MTHIQYELRRAALAVAIFVLGTGAAVAAEMSIRFTTDTTQTSLPIWWAQEHGLFEKHGLEYSDTLVNAGFLGLQAIGAGRNDASIQSDPPTCSNIAKGIDAVVVAIVAKGDNSMALVAEKQYESVEDLVGEKILWMTGTGGELGFIKYLEVRGLTLSDFEQVNLPPAEAVPTLVNGGAAAMWYWEPWPRKALSLKPDGLRLLARSSRDDYDLNMVLTVRREFAEQNSEAVKTFLRVLIEASEEMNADPAAAAALYADKLRTPLEDAEEALGDYPVEINLNEAYFEEVQEICQLLVDLGRVESSPDWAEVVDPSYLRAIAPDRVRNFPY